MQPKPDLLPTPRHLTFLAGELTLPENGLIVLNAPAPHHLRFTAAVLQNALHLQAGRRWELVAGVASAQEHPAVRLNLVPGSVRHQQGYELTVTSGGVDLIAASAASLFYGVQTLVQLLQQYGRSLPWLRIGDWSDFPQRGVMLDISRDKVPTMETLFELIDMLAAWKINQLQLYTEHTFAYRQHPEVWVEASPLTGQEILTLDAYCRERFIELVPNQNTFGHMRRWLIHERYNPLAECPGGCDTVWGRFDEPFTLNPLDPGSLDLVRSLMDELLPHFSSRHFNVGCDETVDLGQGRSRQAVAERGVGRVYLDFLLKIYREVKVRGRTMQFWGDILMEHPELVAELPRDVIALEWGYEADHPFDAHGATFAASGIPFYVCPGTASWNSVAGRTDNAMANLRNAAENGLAHGATGYLITDWGDNGHWQPLPVSTLGFAYGAALAWATAANRDLDIRQALDRFAFRDKAQVMGQVAYDLGNSYLQPGVRPHNGSSLFYTLQKTPGQITAQTELSAEAMRQTLAYIDQTVAPLGQAQISRPDAELIQREFTWCADLLRHACHRILWAQTSSEEAGSLRSQLLAQADRLIDEYQALWLARYRPGGLKDSRARLEKMRADYL